MSERDIYRNACQLQRILRDRTDHGSVVYFHPIEPKIESDRSFRRPRGFVFRENGNRISYWQFVSEDTLCIESGCQQTTDRLMQIADEYMACKKIYRLGAY